MTEAKSQGSSIRELDPRCKVIAFTLLSLWAFVFNHPAYVGAGLALALWLAGVARCLKVLWAMRILLVVLFAATVVMWQFYIVGPTFLAQLGPLRLSVEGLLFGLAAALRFVYLLTIGAIFAAVTIAEDIQQALVRFGVPFKVAFVIGATIRLVPAYASIAQTIGEAQRARGFDLSSRNPVVRIRRIAPLTIPFLLHATRTGQRMAVALETKGFSTTGGPRTYLNTAVMRRVDLAVLAGVSVFVGCCVVLRLQGYGVVIGGRL